MYWFRTYLFLLGWLFALPFLLAQSPKNAQLDVTNATLALIADFCSDEMETVVIDGLEANTFRRQNINIGAIPNNKSVSYMDKADFDNDGDMDIVAGTTTTKIYVLENQGNGNFMRHEVYNNANNTLIIKAIDLDGDGDTDIVNESTGGDLIWLENQGNFNFNLVQIGPMSQPNWSDFDFWDYDADGDIDVFATNNTVSRFTNPGSSSGNFTSTGLNLPPNIILFKFMDADQDGDMDILAYQFDNGQGNVLLLTNDGTQNFTSSVVFDLNAANLIIYHRLQVGDLNQDNYPDFVVGMTRFTGQLDNFLYQFINNQDGTFTPVDLLGTINVNNENLASYHLADLDNEGHLDIAVSIQRRDHLALLYNDGTGNFVERATMDIAADGATDLLIGSFQGNNNLDIIASEISPSNGLHIYENSTVITNPLVLDYNLGPDLNSSIENMKVDGTGKATGQIQLSPGEKNVQFTRLTDSDNNTGSVNFTDVVYVNHAATEIDLSGNSISIADGDNTPTTTDGTDFGNVEVNTTATQTFSINNQGTAALKLRDNARVTVSDPNFNVSISNISTINPNNALTFQVAYQPTTVGVHTAAVEILNNDCDETLYNFTITGNSFQPLPIVLTDFTAKATLDNEVILRWETELEENATGFQIEWSRDGKDWRNLDFVFAKNAAATYEYRHQHPPSGNNFYQLNLIDFDSSSKYSPVVQVRINAQDLLSERLFFPNPAKDNLQIALPTNFSLQQPLQLHVFTPTGQLLRHLELRGTPQISVGDLPAGLYFMELRQGELRTGQRVVIAK